MDDFRDLEWEEASNSDEAPRYYRCVLKDPFRGDRVSIHLYKPSVVALIKKRISGWGHAYTYEDLERREDGKTT